jgi:hypothetical protein
MYHPCLSVQLGHKDGTQTVYIENIGHLSHVMTWFEHVTVGNEPLILMYVRLQGHRVHVM